MQKFIIPDIGAPPSTGTILGQDARHIHKVLRLTAGDHIFVTNGTGKDFTAMITAVSPGSITIEVLEQSAFTYESPLHITLCSGMLKDNKMDLVIKHVTQLGICEWIPFFCERSIPCPDKKRMEKRQARWDAIARESLKQCRRSRLPEIKAPLQFKTLVSSFRPEDLKIAFWEKAVTRLNSLKRIDPSPRVILLIGPEGGFSENEIQLAEENGFSSYFLGPRILRAETASISCCTLIQHILGDI
jgi:16S rRNA (uracil1498-N3)-methyltransferase